MIEKWNYFDAPTLKIFLQNETFDFRIIHNHEGKL